MNNKDLGSINSEVQVNEDQYIYEDEDVVERLMDEDEFYDANDEVRDTSMDNRDSMESSKSNITILIINDIGSEIINTS